jgi:hypothetical protein
MTVAIALKVHDGVVLAADSAVTMGVRVVDGELLQNVYNRADKTFNLTKGKSIGAVGWGLGNIGSASLATLMKDLRKRFTDGHLGPDGEEWMLPDHYTIEWVAARVKGFLFDELYKPFYDKLAGEAEANGRKPHWPYMGMLIVGYSAGRSSPEVWQLVVKEGKAHAHRLAAPEEENAMFWGGQGDAVFRLVGGMDSRVAPLLEKELKGKVDPAELTAALARVAAETTAAMLPPAMPIQDVIDLAYFLVDTCVKYSRYTPGYQTIGGPIDIAAITKHEGFRWVQRKHYYDAKLNPSREP